MPLLKEREAILKWISDVRVPNPVCVTLTEKQFYKGIRLDPIRSDQNFRHFLNLLNRKVYGNSYRRFDRRLNVFSVKEVSLNDRHHRHCMIEVPTNQTFEQFYSKLEWCWKETDFGYDNIHIDQPTSIFEEDGWYNYILKFKTKTDFSTSIDWNNVTVPNH